MKFCFICIPVQLTQFYKLNCAEKSENKEKLAHKIHWSVTTKSQIALISLLQKSDRLLGQSKLYFSISVCSTAISAEMLRSL